MFSASREVSSATVSGAERSYQEIALTKNVRMRRLRRLLGVAIRAQEGWQVVIPALEFEVQCRHESAALVRRLVRARRVYLGEYSARDDHQATRPGKGRRPVLRLVVVEFGHDRRDFDIEDFGRKGRSPSDID